LNETHREIAAVPWKGVEVTFVEAQQLYQSVVFAFVARRIRPVEDAEDIVAAVFVDAFRGWNRRKGEPRLWLLGIARRKVADALRRKRTWWNVRETDATSDAMSEFIHKAQVSAATEIIAKLPEDERDALLMQILEELPIEEIAIVIGRSAQATNSLLQRARSRVRRMAASQSKELTHE